MLVADEDALADAIEEARTPKEEPILGWGVTGSAAHIQVLSDSQYLPELTMACERVLRGFCTGLEARLTRSLERMVAQDSWTALHEAAKVCSCTTIRCGGFHTLPRG